MKPPRDYYYFTGETLDGDLISFESMEPITEEFAKWKAYDAIRPYGGHIDAFYAETDDFAFDVEV